MRRRALRRGRRRHHDEERGGDRDRGNVAGRTVARSAKAAGSPLVAMRADLQAVVVEGLDIELVAAARPRLRIAVDRRRDSHLLALRGERVRVVVVDADGDVVDGSGVGQLVRPRNPSPSPRFSPPFPGRLTTLMLNSAE